LGYWFLKVGAYQTQVIGAAGASPFGTMRNAGRSLNVRAIRRPPKRVGLLLLLESILGKGAEEQTGPSGIEASRPL
jgi:hypothetical protein